MNIVQNDMDIIRFLRRKRMQGLALNFLLKRNERYMSAHLAYSRPLRNENDPKSGSKAEGDTDIVDVGDKFDHLEGLDSRDYFMIAFFKRYGPLIYSLKQPKDNANAEPEPEPSSG